MKKMATTDIIAIIAIVVSLTTAIYTIYIQFFYKKRKFIITVAHAKVNEESIVACVVFSNIGNQDILISNTCLQLDSPSNLSLYTHQNFKHRNIWNSFVISGSSQKSIYLEYNLSFFNNIEPYPINLRLNTNYISANGDIYSDQFHFGSLFLTTKKALAIQLDLKCRKPQGYKFSESMQVAD